MVNQAVKLGATPTSPGSLSCSLSASMLALPLGAVMPFLSGASVSSASLALSCHTLLSASPRELAAHVMHPKVLVYDSDVYTLHVCDDRPGVLAASATVTSSSRLHLPSRCSWLQERYPLVLAVTASLFNYYGLRWRHTELWLSLARQGMSRGRADALASVQRRPFRRSSG